MVAQGKGRIIGTILLTGFLLFVSFFILEFISLEGCICYFGFDSTLFSKIIGYALLTVSTLLFIASIWQIKKLSRWWTIIALIIFGMAFYGNGYKIFSMQGGCGYSINKTTCFIIDTKLGDFATEWGLNIDSLETGKYKGKLLGYSISGKVLTLYRIGEKPLKVNTSFLFWKVRPDIIIHRLSPDLHSFRNMKFEENNSGFEFIGGQDMPLEIFMEEISLEKNEFAGRELKNKRTINETDGTTRFRFEVD